MKKITGAQQNDINIPKVNETFCQTEK